MTTKRSRDLASILSKDVNASEDANEEIERRTKYIKRELDSMDEEQLTRFEFFVRSHFSRKAVKDVLTNSLHGRYAINDEVAIIAGGLAKLFVGEIMEIAMDVLRERGDEEAGVLPEHLEEAYRRLQQDGKVGRLPDRAFLFSSQCSGWGCSSRSSDTRLLGNDVFAQLPEGTTDIDSDGASTIARMDADKLK
mmetsp:Transcript_1600/g.2646  ORF Transcript_1600/g.2646 Transcript_1600/m.2646 type:complete len:193 (+) Transcript_1600:103-681(+)|eukprot:CAMPEP_0174972514 /NCGR_PEP_ID=MMETSP0004_2-20121128/10674_1 /TAXON_ID=420556 /ORGANISM="Ochromonas sp., Strain CCMP1393" /LENGTH=192 /DNA_ID=CAMNT_0016222751 /DNA_START=91 /DNA_END=669 /DNA_ORIENTATION=+